MHMAGLVCWCLAALLVQATLVPKRLPALADGLSAAAKRQPAHDPHAGYADYDDYGGRPGGLLGRGAGGRPPRARCLLSTVTQLQVVTVTFVDYSEVASLYTQTDLRSTLQTVVNTRVSTATASTATTATVTLRRNIFLTTTQARTASVPVTTTGMLRRCADC